LLSGLVGDTGQTRVVNVRNDGALPFLPDDHVIEVPARVSASGFDVLPIDPLPDDIRGLISAVAGYERLALDAAVHGSRDAVLRAMQAHPLVLQYERAEKLTELLIAHNRDHLAWAK
jgi:6-phospho-beta-glucosidase